MTAVKEMRQTAPKTVQKRDGQKVPFEREKVVSAVRKCIVNGMGRPESEAEPVAESVARAVCLILSRNGDGVTVEEVQRLVIQQLWALGHFDAAEQYTLYRDERRRSREARPIPADTSARVAEDQKHFPIDLQYYQFMSKFSRWREVEGRRETWRETVYDRVIPWLKNRPMVKGKLDENEWKELADAQFNLQVSPAMRVVQMAGPALDRCEVGAYNCAYAPFDDLRAFAEHLYVLMQGTGASFSVEDEYISQLPRVKKQKKATPKKVVVPDDTEGWCDSFLVGLEHWFDGYDVEYDTSNVRRAGARLRIKGGRASGPGPLLELFAFARNLILSRQGRYLEDTDAHRIGCMVGKIVQVGGVRRASCLSLSDLDSQSMRSIKSGDWYMAHKYLSMANNSAVYEFDGPVPMDVFMEEWTALKKSGAGERGIFNRKAVQALRPKRRKNSRFGTNPCAEIVLRPREFCNLSIAVARPDDTVESLERKVRLATKFGVVQSTLTNFQYLRDEWKKNCEEERLLGVDVTGHADCPLLHPNNPERPVLLRRLKQVVHEEKVRLADIFGINLSAADTCVKPAGDSSVFFNCGAGKSPWFAAHRIRWVREGIHSPVAAFLKDAGVLHAEAPEDPSLLVFGFPVKAPPGSILRNDLTAVEQLEDWLCWKENYAEHSVSATIYIDEHEWMDAGAWVYKHIEQVTGIAFLPKDNGRYTYAPNEELTEEQYMEMVSKFPKLNWAKLPQYEPEDMTEASATIACTGGVCEL